MTYRGNGQTERTDKGNTTYLYDRTFIPPVVENDGTTITTYITAPSGSLLGFKRGTSYYWYLKDAIGSVVGVMDNSGTVVNTYSYDPFGNILTSSETVTQPFKFAGAYYDAELTLYKMGARYYDPRIGRFLQPDPLGMDLMSPTTWDLYAYAGNNPVNWTDASGEVCWKCWGEKLVGNSGYFDLNVGVGLIVGVTFGVVLDRDGLRLYVGGGFVALPGVSVTASPNSPTEAWNAGIQRDPTWQLRMEWTSWHGLLPRARPVHRGGSGTPGLHMHQLNGFSYVRIAEAPAARGPGHGIVQGGPLLVEPASSRTAAMKSLGFQAGLPKLMRMGIRNTGPLTYWLLRLSSMAVDQISGMWVVLVVRDVLLLSVVSVTGLLMVMNYRRFGTWRWRVNRRFPWQQADTERTHQFSVLAMGVMLIAITVTIVVWDALSS